MPNGNGNDLDSWKYDLTPGNIERYKAIYGQKGAHMLSFFGKNTLPFYKAIRSELGQAMLKEVMVNLQSLTVKILSEKATDREWGEYKCYRNLFESWTRRIAKHLEMVEKVKGA